MSTNIIYIVRRGEYDQDTNRWVREETVASYTQREHAESHIWDIIKKHVTSQPDFRPENLDASMQDHIVSRPGDDRLWRTTDKSTGAHTYYMVHF